MTDLQIIAVVLIVCGLFGVASDLKRLWHKHRDRKKESSEQ